MRYAYFPWMGLIGCYLTVTCASFPFLEIKQKNYAEKGSLLLKVIDQTNVKQSPIVIYAIDIFWGKNIPD